MKPPRTLAQVRQFPLFYWPVGNILLIKGMFLDTMRNMFFCFSDVTIVIIYWDINNGCMATKPEAQNCDIRFLNISIKIRDFDFKSARITGVRRMDVT